MKTLKAVIWLSLLITLCTVTLYPQSIGAIWLQLDGTNVLYRAEDELLMPMAGVWALKDQDVYDVFVGDCLAKNPGQNVMCEATGVMEMGAEAAERAHRAFYKIVMGEDAQDVLRAERVFLEKPEE